MIVRLADIELESKLSYFPAVGIIGARQVGKTTLAQSKLAYLKRDSVYIDLENPEDEAKLFDPVLFFRQNQDKCVILDEVQRRPDLFSVMRSMIDQHRETGRFILLGSASPELIRDTSESLAGRISYLELDPLNLIEVGNTFENMQQLWLRGGFPRSYLAPKDKLSQDWRASFIRSYVERDLPLLGLDADRAVIMKLWRMIAHTHGNVVNFSSLGRALGLTSNTINKYVHFMRGAFLLRLLEPYHTNVKKRLVKSPKVYVKDSGIVHKLLSIGSMTDLNATPALGASWEGFVIDQIAAVAGDKFDYAFYRTHEGTECDLVLLKGGRPHFAIEIKYTSSPTPTKGMLQAFEDLQAANNFIITPASEDFLLRKDIRACSLNAFLERYLLPELA